MEVGKGGSLIAEANVFEDVGAGDAKTASPPQEAGGTLFAPITPQEASSCQSALGRACLSNTMSGGKGGAAQKFAANQAALGAAKVIVLILISSGSFSPFLQCFWTLTKKNHPQNLPAIRSAAVKPPASVASRKAGDCGVGKMK